MLPGLHLERGWSGTKASGSYALVFMPRLLVETSAPSCVCPSLNAELKEHAHDFEFEVEKFVDFGEEDDEEFFLRTRWLGFEAMDDTWERLQKMIEDVPRVVVKYLETIREQHAKIPELIKNIKEEMKNARK